MNWLFPLARVIGAGVPFGGVLVQLNAEWDARKVQERLQKLEDPISSLHPDVREFSRVAYDHIRATGESRLELSEADLAKYSRVIAILEGSGSLRGQHVLGRQHPLACWLNDPTYVLYMAALFEDPDAMAGLTDRVNSGSAGTWLRGADLAKEYRVPLPVVRAMFQLYERRGLGLLSREIGATNYLCKA